ncbi:hypothetical protein [Bacillus subtilis]|uniref:Uncharacterized protein n=1 Tax=Bacillus vallismortis TaxID=72361 RepID=A0AAP3CLU9_BACVA|nr:hypothetical protein [Bacillus inaquosorum]MCY8318779.1 hypothetical protein [Bacillus vallismortis]MCY8413185.1 hypothetical protein [Bacillus spizizenii]MCY8248138.1 hypothetical protein [Bacillus inaquosorum]MCY8251326.1 hypothetical protein [Bacillus inaquosorum]
MIAFGMLVATLSKKEK